jgi:hypothetical protein
VTPTGLSDLEDSLSLSQDMAPPGLNMVQELLRLVGSIHGPLDLTAWPLICALPEATTLILTYYTISGEFSPRDHVQPTQMISALFPCLAV